MEFSSFIPKRHQASRPMPSPMPSTPATASYTSSSGWQGILDDHIQAQAHAPVEPSRVPPVGSRQDPNLSTPQRPMQIPKPSQTNANAETTVFPKIEKPPPNYQYPAQPNHQYPVQQMPIYNPQTANSASSPPPPPPPPPYDATDFTQVMAKIDQESPQPVESKRFLRYYNVTRNGLLSVVGYQVHSANAYGVLITENMHSRRTLIPWHRVYELVAEPNDPILSTR